MFVGERIELVNISQSMENHCHPTQPYSDYHYHYYYYYYYYYYTFVS